MLAPRAVVVSPFWRILSNLGLVRLRIQLDSSNGEHICQKRHKRVQLGIRRRELRSMRSRSSRIHDDLERFLILSGARAHLLGSRLHSNFKPPRYTVRPRTPILAATPCLMGFLALLCHNAESNNGCWLRRSGTPRIWHNLLGFHIRGRAFEMRPQRTSSNRPSCSSDNDKAR